MSALGKTSGQESTPIAESVSVDSHSRGPFAALLATVVARASISSPALKPDLSPRILDAWSDIEESAPAEIGTDCEGRASYASRSTGTGGGTSDSDDTELLSTPGWQLAGSRAIAALRSDELEESDGEASAFDFPCASNYSELTELVVLEHDRISACVDTNLHAQRWGSVGARTAAALNFEDVESSSSDSDIEVECQEEIAHRWGSVGARTAAALNFEDSEDSANESDSESERPKELARRWGSVGARTAAALTFEDSEDSANESEEETDSMMKAVTKTQVDFSESDHSSASTAVTNLY